MSVDGTPDLRAPDYCQSNVDIHPGGRLGTPEQVANVSVFLSSPMASWVTGQHFVVDGAFTKRIAY